MSDESGSGTASPLGPIRPPPQGIARLSGRLWCALAFGITLALATGWALAFLAPLPGGLGLFFFLVSGLLIGAAMYRIGAPAAPVSRSRLYLVGLGVTSVLWGFGLLNEYRALPRMAFAALRPTIKFTLSPERKELIKISVNKYIKSKLEDSYPPGGILGYLRWVGTSGEMSIPRVIDSAPFKFTLRQRRWGWMVRVALSFILASGAVLSQILPLARVLSPAKAAMDNPAPV